MQNGTNKSSTGIQRNNTGKSHEVRADSICCNTALLRNSHAHNRISIYNSKPIQWSNTSLRKTKLKDPFRVLGFLENSFDSINVWYHNISNLILHKLDINTTKFFWGIIW